MKTFILTIFAAGFLAGCINSSTAWTNRSVTYQVTPEQIGEHSAVTGSPTSNDANVNADKTFETAAKTNVAQNLADNSSNDQSKNQDKDKDKDKEAETQPVEDTPLIK